MATFDFRILLETINGNKTSYISSSFVDTSQDLVLSASEVHSRITSSNSCSFQNTPNFTGAIFTGSFSGSINNRFVSNSLLSSSLTGSMNTGSIVFTSLNDDYDRLYRYKFFGEKVCNVLGLPSNQWVYVDQFSLNADDENNYFEGNVNATNIFLGNTLTFAGNANINSDVPVYIDQTSDRYVKFIDTSGSGVSQAALVMGYDVDTNKYELSSSAGVTFDIGGVNTMDVDTLTVKNLETATETTTTQIDVTGDITASGNISASGTVSASRIVGADGAFFANNIDIVGNVTADTFTTTNIDSDFSTGNTIFGNTVDDRHQFTGSLLVSSSNVNILDNGKVGIGTAFPTKKLQVTGDISASGDIITTGTVSASNFYLTASGQNVVQVGNSGEYLSKWEWHRNGTRKWVIYNDGRTSGVGGQDSLVFKHGVDSDGNDHINFYMKPDDQTVYFAGDISSSGDLYIQGLMSASGAINTTSHITASGNISSSGEISAGTLKVAGGSLTVEDTSIINQDVTSDANVTFNSVDADGGITIDNITIDGTEIDLSSGDLTIDVAGDMTIDVDGGNFDIQDGGADIFNVSSTKISGSSLSTGSFAFSHIADALGIGTKVPSASLEVVSSNEIVGQFTRTGDQSVNLRLAGDDAKYTNIIGGTDNPFFITYGGDGELGSADGTSTLFFIDSTGKVAIGGHTDPGTTLEVVGDISASGFVSASYFGGDGSALTGITAEWDGTHDGDGQISGSLTISGSGDTRLTLEGQISSSGPINTLSDITSSGNLTVGGDISASGALKGASADINGAVDIDGGALTVGTGIQLTDSGVFNFGTNLDNGRITWGTEYASLYGLSATTKLRLGSMNTQGVLTISSSHENTMVISGSSVGIGTTSPSATLHISSSTDPNLIIENNDGSSILRFRRTDNNKNFDVSMEGDDLRFIPNTTDGTSNVIIGSNAASNKIDSRLGVGTATPREMVDVSGSVIVEGDISSSGYISTLSHITASGNISSSGEVSAETLKVSSFGVTVEAASTLNQDLTTDADVTFASVDADGGVTIDNITIDGTEIDLSSGDLDIDVAGDMVIDVDGGNFDVKDGGIGLLNVSATQVSASETSTGSLGAGYFISEVGIGTSTTTPGAKFVVAGGNISASRSDNNMLMDLSSEAANSNHDVGIRFRKTGSLAGTIGYNAGTDTINLNYGAFDNTHLNIDQNGNIGFGTSNPQSKIHSEQGDIRINMSTGDGSTNTEKRLVWSEGSAFNERAVIAYDTQNNIFDIRTDDAGGDLADRIRIRSEGEYDLTQVEITGEITASGAISSSGKLTGADLEIDDGNISTVGSIGLQIRQTDDHLDSGSFTIYSSNWSGSSAERTRVAIGVTSASDASSGRGSFINTTYNTGGTNALRFLQNSTEKMRIDHGGNVGIGTTSPGQELEVLGNISASGDLTIGNGKIGIGVLDPQQKLHISGNIYLGSAGASSPETKHFIHGNNNVAVSSDADVMIVADSNMTNGVVENKITFGFGSAVNTNTTENFTYGQAYPTNVSDVEVMRIVGDTERVGIGSTSPTSKLTVISASRVAEFGSSSLEDQYIQVRHNNAGLKMGIDSSLNNGKGGGLIQGGLNKPLYFATENSTFGAETPTMTISSSLVGIGTTTPSNTLTVAGDISASGVIYARRFESSGSGDAIDFVDNIDVTGQITASGTISASGKIFGDGGSFNSPVSIGTTDFHSDERLHVYRNGADSVIKIHEDAGSHKGMLYYRVGGTDMKLYVTASDSSFNIDTETVERAFVLGNTGNVGINTTSPLEKLHIAGNTIIEEKLGAETYLSGFTGYGWRFDPNYGAPVGGSDSGSGALLELDHLSVRGTMNIYELLINQIRATNGNLFISSVGKVSESIAVPAADTGSVSYTHILTVETGSGMGHGFQTNDLIRAQRFDHNGNTVFRTDMKVTGSITSPSFFSASLEAGTPPSGGYEFVRLGNVTDSNRRGSVYLTSDDIYAPYIDVVDGVTSFDDFNNTGSVKTRMGRLDGITSDNFGDLEGYGFWASGSAYLEGTINADGGTIGGWNIGSTQISSSNVTINSAGNITLGGSDQISLDGTADSNKGVITVGSGVRISGSSVGEIQLGAATDINNGAGSFLDGNGTFRVGASIGGDRVYFDGNNLNITSSKFQINSGDTTITTDKFELDAGTGDLQLSSTHASMSLGDGKIILTGSSVPIIKINGGEISASNFFVDAQGQMTASAGKIGGWVIDSNNLYSSEFTMSSADGGIININSGSIIISGSGEGQFANGGILFTKDGDLTVSGTLSSSVGNIGGFTLDTDEIKSRNASGDTGLRLKASGQITASDAKIIGDITATSGLFSGDVVAAHINATSGSIGGWKIGVTELSSSNITMSNANGGKISLNSDSIFLSGSGEGKLSDGSISFDKFGNLEIQDASLRIKETSVQSDIYDTSNSKRIVLLDKVVRYGAFEDDTLISVISQSGEVVKTITASRYETGSILASEIETGSILDSNKPVAFVSDGGHSVMPMSALGQTFLHANIRGQNPDVDTRYYSPYGDAHVTMSADSSSNYTGNYSEVETFTVSQSVVTSRVVQMVSRSVFRVTSDMPLLLAARSSSNSHIQYLSIPPATNKHAFIGRSAKTILSQTSSLQSFDEFEPSANGSASSSMVLISDRPIARYGYADGGGSDANLGLPLEMLGDTYMIPHGVGGYQIMSVEPTTIYTYKVHPNGTREILETINHTTSSITNPSYHSTGSFGHRYTGSDGANRGISAQAMIFEGTAPFLLRTNDTSDDEYISYGYRRVQRNQYENSTVISGDKIRTGRILSTNYGFTAGDYADAGMKIDLNEGSVTSTGFAIDSSGNAKFSGSISSSIGNIGGFTLGKNTLSTKGFEIADQTQTYALSSSKFQVDHDGNLTASNVDLTGNIKASSGEFTGSITSSAGIIGGWTISTGNLQSVTSNGGIALNSEDPEINIRTGSNSDTIILRLGDLGTNDFGIKGWDTSGNEIFELSEVQNKIAGWNFNASEIYNSNITMSNANGGSINIKSGSILLSGSGEGQLANGQITFDKDGTNLIVSGTLSSSIGNIGGWTIDTGKLKKGTDFELAPTSTYIISSSNFQVDASGNVTASNVDLSGKITATTGEVGGFDIDNTTISSSNLLLSSSAGPDDFVISASNFNVKGSGKLTATDAEISGTIKATSGEFTGSITASDGMIGGFTIGTHTISTAGFEIGDENQTYALSSSKFQVDHEGNLTASNVQLTGSISASGGTIGGFVISSDKIESDNLLLSSSLSTSDYLISASAFNVKGGGQFTASDAKIAGEITVTNTGDFYQPNKAKSDYRLALVGTSSNADTDARKFGNLYTITSSYGYTNITVSVTASQQAADQVGGDPSYDLFVVDHYVWGVNSSPNNAQKILNLLDDGKSVISFGNDTTPSNKTGSDGTMWPILETEDMSLTDDGNWQRGTKATGSGLLENDPIGFGWTTWSNNHSTDSGKSIVKAKTTLGGASSLVPLAVSGGFDETYGDTYIDNHTSDTGDISTNTTADYLAFYVTNPRGGRWVHMQNSNFSQIDTTAGTRIIDFLLKKDLDQEQFHNGFTRITGDMIQTGKISSSNYVYTSGDYADVGMAINLDEGSMIAKGFSVNSNGNASFSGSVSSSEGNIGGFTIDEDEIKSGNLKLNSDVETLQLGTVVDFDKDGTNKGLFVSGTGDFFIGQENSDYIHFDASAGTLAISSSDLKVEVGDLHITASDIDMTTDSFELDATGLELSSTRASMSLGEGKIILSGSTVPTIKLDGGEISASHFFVDAQGQMTASAGKIGGWEISGSTLSASNYDDKSLILEGGIVPSINFQSTPAAEGLQTTMFIRSADDEFNENTSIISASNAIVRITRNFAYGTDDSRGGEIPAEEAGETSPGYLQGINTIAGISNFTGSAPGLIRTAGVAGLSTGGISTNAQDIARIQHVGLLGSSSNAQNHYSAVFLGGPVYSENHITASALHIAKDVDAGSSLITVANTNTDNGTDKFAGIEFKHGGTTDLGTTKLFKPAGKILAGKDGGYQLGTNGEDSNLGFYTALNGTDTERLRITSEGEARFEGKISSSHVLEINDTSAKVAIGDNVAGSLDGIVVTGQISASNTLTVKHNTDHTDLIIDVNANNKDSRLLFRGQGSNQFWILNDTSEETFRIYDDINNSDQLIVTSSNVGIGIQSGNDVAKKLTVEGDISASGTFFGKQHHIQHHNFNFNQDAATDIYLPINSLSEGDNVGDQHQWIAPFDGELEKVMFRALNGDDGGNLICKCYVNGSVVEVETVSSTEVGTTATFTFSNSSTFSAGDILRVSIQAQNEIGGDCIATTLWLYDTAKIL